MFAYVKLLSYFLMNFNEFFHDEITKRRGVLLTRSLVVTCI